MSQSPTPFGWFDVGVARLISSANKGADYIQSPTIPHLHTVCPTCRLVLINCRRHRSRSTADVREYMYGSSMHCIFPIMGVLVGALLSWRHVFCDISALVSCYAQAGRYIYVKRGPASPYNRLSRLREYLFYPQTNHGYGNPRCASRECS